MLGVDNLSAQFYLPPPYKPRRNPTVVHIGITSVTVTRAFVNIMYHSAVHIENYYHTSEKDMIS